jgi:hypothetical protein
VDPVVTLLAKIDKLRYIGLAQLFVTEVNAMSTAATEAGEREKKPDKKTITVIYLGDPRLLDYEPEELVKDALAKALDLFGITSNRHLMALFAEDGNELTNEEQSLKHAGVKRGDKLLLGQSRVKGGSWKGR